jgi:hypothetical protein
LIEDFAGFLLFIERGVLKMVVEKKEFSVGKVVKTTLIVILVIAVVCAIIYALYRYFTPDYDDDFDDDFDDAFDDDDDLFDEEESSAVAAED